MPRSGSVLSPNGADRIRALGRRRIRGRDDFDLVPA
jgi:hypothetical protein